MNGKTAFLTAGCLAVALSVVIGTFSVEADTTAAKPTVNFDASGKISLPKDFRKNMVHLGSWFVPEGGASGFHDVYTEKESLEAYRKTGEFPDGATLVKQLRGHTSGDYTTGSGVSYANATLKQTFVMVKDAKGRFPDNKNWGKGWGWALFKPGKTGNLSTNFKEDCLGCHVPAEKNDHVYIEAYPSLTGK